MPFAKLSENQEGPGMARSGSTPSVRNGAQNGQSYIDRQKKRPPGWAASRFDQFAEVSIRLQKTLVSRLSEGEAG
jgi:hypothetical protein